MIDSGTAAAGGFTDEGKNVSNELSVRDAEEKIQELRDKVFNPGSGNAEELYRAAQACFRETDFAEEWFSSDGMYWWYRTIRETAYEAFANGFGQKVTVSVTSYPARMKVLAESLKTVFDQTRKPDAVTVWLAEASFPGKEADLPEEISRWAEERKITVRWCEDLKPHKKYYWMLQENREHVTVTVDDDLRYAPDMLEMLLLSFIRHPKAVSAMRVHLMAVAEGRKVLPYRNWVMETDAEPDRPGMDLFATTGAGTLYPPGLISGRFFDRQAILDTCLMADDLWMKANELMEGIPVVLACRNRGLHFVPGSQDDTLWQTNREQNDEQWKKIRDLIDSREGEGALERKLCEVRMENYSVHAGRKADALLERVKQVRREKDELAQKLRQERTDRKKAEQKVQQLTAEKEALLQSRDYRIGHRMLKPLRKLRDLAKK